MNWLEKYRPATFDGFWQKSAAGLTLIKRAVTLSQLPQVILLVAGYGLGKTSLARVLGRRFNCWNNRHAYNPCNECVGCREITPSDGGTHVCDGYLEYDVTSHTPAHIVNAVAEHVRCCKMNRSHNVAMPPDWIVCLDEIARVKNTMQEALIKVVENAKNARFVLCFSDPAPIIDPIRERGVLIELPLPTTTEATEALMEIARREGLVLEELVARQIAESARRVPRRCILALQQAAVLAASNVIDLQTAEEAINFIAR